MDGRKKCRLSGVEIPALMCRLQMQASRGNLEAVLHSAIELVQAYNSRPHYTRSDSIDVIAGLDAINMTLIRQCKKAGIRTLGDLFEMSRDMARDAKIHEVHFESLKVACRIALREFSQRRED